jgi:coenzyme Q-binding protein COQ10
MPKHSEHSLLPFTPEQLFDLVADVEHYAEFVPWWVAARVSQRDGDIVYVEQVIGLGVIQRRFTSRAVLQRPVSVHITSQDRFFEYLSITWRIQPLTQGHTTILLTTEFSLHSGLLQILFKKLFFQETKRLIEAFEHRAQQLYG